MAERNEGTCPPRAGQGYLTYNDIKTLAGETSPHPKTSTELLIKLRNSEVEIVDQAEVDRVKRHRSRKRRMKKPALISWTNPSACTFKQMGQVPLLTREQ